eukprot:309994_1
MSADLGSELPEIFDQINTVILYWIRDLHLKKKYHVDLNKVIFQYCTNYIWMTEYDQSQPVQVLNNGTIIKYKSDTIVSLEGIDFNSINSDVAFRYGVNSFSVQLIEHGFICAFGFVEKPKDIKKWKCFGAKDGINTGYTYFLNLYGDVGYTDDVGGRVVEKRIDKFTRDAENDPRIKVNDIILITLDLNKGEIVYEINNEHIWTETNVIKDKIYYPCIWFGAVEKDEYHECKVNVKCCLH